MRQSRLDALTDPRWDRKIRLFSVACCRQNSLMLTDDRSRHVLKVVEDHVDGHATDWELEEAQNIAQEAVTLSRSLAFEPIVGSDVARHYLHADRTLYDLVDREMAILADAAADGDARVRAASACWDCASSSEQLREVGLLQVDEAKNVLGHLNVLNPGQLLRCIVGNPFRPVAFAPEWRTTVAVEIAAQIYESRDFGSLPVLADALEEAGCDHPAVLAHCREPGEHARGCWVVDGVLGKG